MPDFYAHQVFGQLVYEALPKELQIRLTPELPGFRCGLYGPDPLFFYHPSKSNPVCAEGHALHSCPPQTVLDHYRSEAACETPYALGFAAGFLCHYLLDCACHPVVDALSAGSSLRHTVIEGALDRALIPPGGDGLPAGEPEDAGVYIAAAIGFTQADPKRYALALKRFLRVSRLVARFRRLTPARRKNRRTAAELKDRMLALVPECAALVVRLVDALERGLALDFLPALDFNGQAVAIPAGV